MDISRTIMLLLHIPAAAILLGAGTGVLRNLRRTLALGKDAFVVAAEDAAQRGNLMSICSGVTLATGVGLIMLMGGMKQAPINYHLALGLMLLAIAVSAAVTKPANTRLLVIARAEALDKEAVPPLLKKLAMGQGIFHLIWFAILCLMVIRIYK